MVVGKSMIALWLVSGGLDFFISLYLACTWGLCILAIHIDDGYNTDI